MIEHVIFVLSFCRSSVGGNQTKVRSELVKEKFDKHEAVDF